MYYLSKIHGAVDHPRHKLVILSLPYTGINGDKVKRQLNRLITTCLPWINFLLLFIPTNKLSKLSKLKCILPIMSNEKLNCSDCPEFYVGMTMRRLHQRLEEHAKFDKSALNEHPLFVIITLSLIALHY